MKNHDRIERFRDELAELKTATRRPRTEQLLLGLSVLLMVAGVVIAFGAYFSSHHSSADAVGQANQRDMIVLALAGIALAAVGGALYLRHSLARFLRFWMLRQLYESHARDDAVEPVASDTSAASSVS